MFSPYTVCLPIRFGRQKVSKVVNFDQIYVPLSMVGGFNLIVYMQEKVKYWCLGHKAL